MPKPKYVSFDLDEVIYFMKEGDFSFFDFDSDHGQGYAQVLTKEAGWLCIYDVSDNVIPVETVRRVLDVLEHWDECLKQAYDWLRFWDFTNDEWRPSKYKECLEEWTHDEFKKVYEITGVYFEETENKDQLNLVHKYRLESKQKKATYGFSIVFTAGYYPLGFTLKYSCEDMRLYAIETYII